MNDYFWGNDSPHAVSIDSDKTFVTKIQDLSTAVEKFTIDRIIFGEFYDTETGEMILRFNFDTGGSDATSANTD